MSADALAPLYEVLDALSFPWCLDCGDCCAMPWLLDEEVAGVSTLPGAQLARERGVAFLANPTRCACLHAGRCAVYTRRPLDCRLFPLDLVEHQGDLWWCIFQSCRAPEALASVLVPAIPALEARLTPTILDQYRRQIAVTRETYAPYREGRYRLIRPLRASATA